MLVDKNNSGFWILHQVRPFCPSIAGAVALAVVSGLLSTLDPLLMRRLIDKELPGHHLEAVMFLVFGIVGCLLGSTLFLLWSVRVNFAVEQELGQKLRVAILEQLNRLSADFHESTPTGDRMTRLGTDVDQISELGAEITSSSLRAIIFFVVNLAVMIHLSWAMTFCVLPSLLLFARVQKRFSSFMSKKADHAQAEAGRASSLLYEYLSALPQIQLLCAEKLVLGQAVATWKQMAEARKTQRNAELLYAGAMNAAFLLTALLVLGVGGYQVLHSVLTIGGLVAFYSYQTRIFEPVSVATDIYSRAQRVGASIRRVRNILDQESVVPDFGTIVEPRKSLAQGISLHGVQFSYSKVMPVVNLTLHIAAQECLGIVGPNGSGKSTFARLLVRFSDPELGDITLDGYPLRDYSLAALRKTICYVPQSPILFNGTIAENLRFANPTATTADLERVMEITQFTSVLEKLPAGLNTMLGPQGHSLSGGERQRLALARALLRDAPVLILDESTSAIDVPAETALISSIIRNRTASILIVISHRLRSLTSLGRIVVLGSGKVVATGTHESLARECPLYQHLWANNGEAAFVN